MSLNRRHPSGEVVESPVPADAGVDDHLEARPDQQQVWHADLQLVDQEVVGGEESAGHQGEADTGQLTVARLGPSLLPAMQAMFDKARHQYNGNIVLLS